MGSGLKITTNPGAITAVRNLRRTGNALHRAVDRLSSGKRLNSVADDAAAMGVTENMRAQRRGYQQALRNASDGVAMVQTAEAGYQSLSDTLVRMRELAVEAANGTLSDVERGYLNAEFAELITEIDRVASVTQYNNVNLLDGSAATLTFQVGARNAAQNQIDITFNDQRATELGIDDDNVSTTTGAQLAVSEIDTALDSLNTDRASLGAKVSRLNLAMNDISSTITNYGQAIGNMRDADLGTESGELARQQVLQAAGIAMLLQAHANTGMALRLLR